MFISVRFDEMDALKNFERELPKILEDTKKAFVHKYSRFSGVCVLSFEREAMSTSIPIIQLELGIHQMDLQLYYSPRSCAFAPHICCMMLTQISM